MTEFLTRLLKDPLGFINRFVLKTIIFPLKYGKRSGYDAEKYWGDRFRNHEMQLKAVGCEGLSEEDNLRAREQAIAVFDEVCRDQNVQFGTINILEIGCGNGFYTNYFHQKGVQNYTGADITDVLFGQLQEKFPGYNFRRKDVTVDRIEGHYDLVVMMDVIQHIVNRQKLLSALGNIRDCLRPNGVFIVAPLTGNSKRHLFHVHRWSVKELDEVFYEGYSRQIIQFRDGEDLVIYSQQQDGIRNFRMNVLVTTSTFPRWENDPGPSFVFDLCRQLARLGLNITVLAPHARGAQRFEVMEGIKVYRYQYLPATWEGLSYDGGILARLRKNKWGVWQIPFFLLAQLRSLMEIVRKEKIDVIHAHWLIPQGLIAAIYKKFFNPGTKVVCTSHGSDIMALKGFLFDWMIGVVVRQADKLTVVSNALKEEVQRIDSRVSVEVLPMGVDPKQFTPERYSEEIKREYSIEGPFLLFVGRLSKEKGTEYLIRAMPEILGKFPLAKLLVVGEGPLEDQLKELCAALNVQANVIFVGAVQHESLPAYYATADVLIGPSTREGFGLVFAEAMACGCPVVVSELPGISDIIKDGETGLYFKATDSAAIAQKVILLLENIQLRQTLRQNGREQIVVNFGWDTIVKCYARLLRGR